MAAGEGRMDRFRLEEIRLEMGLTQREFATLLLIGENQYSRIKRGRTGSVNKQTAKLAEDVYQAFLRRHRRGGEGP
jgi:transcriptional regulator with XRE-family HTH domain